MSTHQVFQISGRVEFSDYLFQQFSKHHFDNFILYNLHFYSYFWVFFQYISMYFTKLHLTTTFSSSKHKMTMDSSTQFLGFYYSKRLTSTGLNWFSVCIPCNIQVIVLPDQYITSALNKHDLHPFPCESNS